MQRKRGDGGRFFSPKDKEEMALAAMQVRQLQLQQQKSGVKQEQDIQRAVEFCSQWLPQGTPPLA